MITTRLLPYNEWSKLYAPFKEAFAELPPYPHEGIKVAVVEEDGVVVGFGTLQQLWHIEPFWVTPKLRGRGFFTKLLDLLAKELPETAAGVLCYTTDGRVARLISCLGLEEMKTWRVFRWVRR